MTGQIQFFGDDPEQAAFVEKFRIKKTTDDCFTPPAVYDAVATWTAEDHGLDRSSFVRPFRPGGDYLAEIDGYGPETVVVDNPPFSILAQIVRAYCARGVRFLLFAPTLTLFMTPDCPVCYLPVGVKIRYENGTVVNTSFITNLETARVRTVPALYQAVRDAQDRSRGRALPKYRWPNHVLTAVMAAKWCECGIEFRAERDDTVYVEKLDAQRSVGKKIFGGGLLLSQRAAVRAAEARAVTEQVTGPSTWDLSDREREIIRGLGLDDDP